MGDGSWDRGETTKLVGLEVGEDGIYIKHELDMDSSEEEILT